MGLLGFRVGGWQLAVGNLAADVTYGSVKYSTFLASLLKEGQVLAVAVLLEFIDGNETKCGGVHTIA